MKILCTGTTGFVGSHLAPKLVEQGHEVVCLQRYVVGRQFEGQNTRIVHADLNDHGAMKQLIIQEQPEIIVHLAALTPVAYSYEHWSEVLKTNFTATANLAEICRVNDESLKQFVFAGTSEEYGQQTEFPIKESADLKPTSPYAVSKVAADKYLRMMWDAYKFPVTVMRPFNTYGRSNNGHFVTEKIINQMLTKTEINLGNSDPVRDFVYIDDHVNAYLKVIDNESVVNRALNVCTGQGTSIRAYVELIGELLGWQGKIHWNTLPERPNDIHKLIGDNTKAKELLGWKPIISLEKGLELTIEQLREEK